MTQRWFAEATTTGAVKSLFRKLALRWHPDRGGDNDTMREIIEAYEQMLAAMDGEISRGSDGKDHEYHYNAKVEREVMEKLMELIALRMPGVEIELIGTWVWASGETKAVKDKLGKDGAGMSYIGKRQMWAWHVKRGYHSRGSDASTDALRAMYGARTYEAADEAAARVA